MLNDFVFLGYILDCWKFNFERKGIHVIFSCYGCICSTCSLAGLVFQIKQEWIHHTLFL